MKMSTIHTSDFSIYIQDPVRSERVEVEIYQPPAGVDGGCRLQATASKAQLIRFATEILKALGEREASQAD